MLLIEPRWPVRWSGRWVGLSRNAIVEPVLIKEKDKALINQIEQLARRHKHWGVLKIYRRLRKQGKLFNH